MDSLGGRTFMDVPGSETHELPPLLVRMTPRARRLEQAMEMAEDLVDQEDLIPLRAEDLVMSSPADIEAQTGRRRMDLALNLVDQYLGLLQHWQWGDGILEWIRQCETTFEARQPLRPLLRPDVWPHSARSSFVVLLEDKVAGDKSVDTHGVGIEKAVGMRLTFRQPPPLKCFSNQFLFYLNTSVAQSAYQTWSQMSPGPVSALPPERFHFDVWNMSLD